MDNINLNTWEDVRVWCDKNPMGCFHTSYVEHINSGMFPKDAFSLGQLASKVWLVDSLYNYCYKSNEDLMCIEPPIIAMLGCWIGALSPLLHQHMDIERIYGFDIDPVAISKAEVFNRRLVADNWKFKGVVQDISLLSCNNMEFETGGELIQVKPDVVINTSCEHMDTQWFDSCDDDQLIVMQTNDSPDFDGHINICNSLSEMQDKYSMKDIKFIGSLKTPVYTRYMQIGYKNAYGRSSG